MSVVFYSLSLFALLLRVNILAYKLVEGSIFII